MTVLDWRPRPDTRNLRYTLTAVGIDTTGTARSRAWTRRTWINQNTYDCPICRQYGACTGYGAAHVLAATPRPKPVSAAQAHGIYHAAKERDEWAGSDYEGSSVLGAMQALKDSGAISAYWWAKDVNQLVHAVSRYGPVEVGTWWYSGMWTPDHTGRIRASGTRDGGHAYCVAAVNTTTRTFRIDNSWGTGWGMGGSALIGYGDMERLLTEQGEAALPRKIR